MEKPETLLALKNMYREWPAVLGYPMLICCAFLSHVYSAGHMFQTTSINGNYKREL